MPLIYETLATIAFVVAGVGWLIAAAYSLMLLGHAAPPNTSSELFFQGHKFFLRDTFLPSGKPLQRRMLQGLGLFLIGFVLAVVFGMLGGLFNAPSAPIPE